MSAGTVIALLGAARTGKTTLAHALAAELCRDGWDACVVPEYLREFCDASGRQASRDEQAAVAAEQTRRIAQAASRHELVLADTTALMTAIHSEQLFQDVSLLEAALQAHAACTLTLLTGLDLPWQAEPGRQHEDPFRREAVDRRIRALLQSRRMPFGVVYGRGPERGQQAMRALQGLLQERRRQAEPPVEPQGPVRWRLKCQDCEAVDPSASDCTHGLFGRLLKPAAGSSD